MSVVYIGRVDCRGALLLVGFSGDRHFGANAVRTVANKVKQDRCTTSRINGFCGYAQSGHNLTMRARCVG